MSPSLQWFHWTHGKMLYGHLFSTEEGAFRWNSCEGNREVNGKNVRFRWPLPIALFLQSEWVETYWHALSLGSILFWRLIAGKVIKITMSIKYFQFILVQFGNRRFGHAICGTPIWGKAEFSKDGPFTVGPAAGLVDPIEKGFLNFVTNYSLANELFNIK